ncbi:hypothetical protein [Antrihabitans sp. YC2-6]|uniref:hypothetical protein n=1 Tax=Antrihabitans sp. YC2-6 TaxID=2799498 RepID=UPI0018F34114|nr:hypothetical protein [Antrihabitans sp. YC2-6]MBJ8344334.1 hypothetical protein [Antrihabitans sp. YC2-6]
MNRFDRQILEFLLAWAPYGGPPEEDVLTEFGMSADQLDKRRHQIVSTQRTGELNDDERQLALRAANLDYRQPANNGTA